MKVFSCTKHTEGRILDIGDGKYDVLVEHITPAQQDKLGHLAERLFELGRRHSGAV